MAFFKDKAGVVQHVEITPMDYKAADSEGKTLPQYLNAKFVADADSALGTPFHQLCASEGMSIYPKDKSNPFGFRNATVADVLDGKAGFSASLSNTEQKGTPFGTASRVLFPAALIQWVEAQVHVDRVTDTIMFEDMVAQTIAVNNDTFAQPVINYNGTGGPQQAKHQRVAQLADVPTMLQITTSDRFRRLPTYGMGIEMSQQAMQSGTIDTLAFTVARYLQVEKDQRVYNFLNSLFAGDNDMCIGAVPSVNSSTLDSAATGGVLTHKAWIRFLARNRKKRRITHVIGDVNTYLAIEGRTGRPGITAYDPRLSVIDPQGKAKNVSFGDDITYFIVEDASAGGPVPANTMWALDATQAITAVTNTAAEYTAIEQFISRRSELLVMNWSHEVYRFFGDAELTPFDAMVLA